MTVTGKFIDAVRVAAVFLTLSLSPADVSIMKQAIPLGGGRVGGAHGCVSRRYPRKSFMQHHSSPSGLIDTFLQEFYVYMHVCMYLCIDVPPPPLPVVRNELSRVRGIPVVLVNK